MIEKYLLFAYCFQETAKMVLLLLLIIWAAVSIRASLKEQKEKAEKKWEYVDDETDQK